MKTKSKATENFFGPMENAIKESGKMANSTGKDA